MKNYRIGQAVFLLRRTLVVPLLVKSTFVVFNVYAQQITVQENALFNRVTLQSNQNTVLTIPSSFPEIISQGESDEPWVNHVNGVNWVLKFSAPGSVFKDISFANPQVGYIATELGSVYKSTNGGDTWTSVLNLGFPYYWYGVHALSADTVIISGFNNQDSINRGVVRWTFNGGSTWSPDIRLRIPGNGVGWLERVHFFNRDTGIVFNSFSGGCWYTTNGGRDTSSWTYILINPDQGWFAGNIDAQPSGHVYATGIHFAHSTNFGTNWASLPSADNVFDGGVDFLDFDNLFGWTGGGQISAPVSGWVHRTTDGGVSWSPRLNTFPFPIRAVRFFTETTGLAVGGNLFQGSGGIYSTTDGGISWNLDVNTSAEMFSIESKMISGDSMDIWCVGSTGGGTGYTGKLYKARTGILTGVSNSPEIPKTFGLYQNYPNPFNPGTTIRFSLPRSEFVTLRIFNLLGGEIATLASGKLSAGIHQVEWNAQGLPSGVYFYRVQAGALSETKKLLLLK